MKSEWREIIKAMVMNGETITGRKLLERRRLDIKRLEGPEEGFMAGPLETNWQKSLTVAPPVDGEQPSPKLIPLVAEKQPRSGRIVSRPLPQMEQRPEEVKHFLSTAKSPIKIETLSKTTLSSRVDSPPKHEPVLGEEAFVKRELRPEEIPLPPSPVLHATTVP